MQCHPFPRVHEGGIVLIVDLKWDEGGISGKDESQPKSRRRIEDYLRPTHNVGDDSIIEKQRVGPFPWASRQVNEMLP